MTIGALFFVVIGIATATSWMFKLIAIIEKKPIR